MTTKQIENVFLASQDEIEEAFIRNEQELPEDDPAREVDRDNYQAAQEDQHRYDEQNSD